MEQNLQELKILEDSLTDLSKLKNRLLYFKLMKTSNIMFTKTNKDKLKIDKTLPQILVPKDKVYMFINWWNDNIRFEKTIPKSFNEGYITLYLDKDFKMPKSNIISLLAKQLKFTYRQTEQILQRQIDETLYSTIYFKFLSDTNIFLKVYDSAGNIISKCNFQTGKSDKCEPCIDMDLSCEPTEECLNQYNVFSIYIFSTIMWYIATTGNNTKYVYTNKQPKYEHKNRDVVDVKDIKYIETPIYDFSKVRVINLDTLNRRKAGWTYSHSFAVHGHYRHYKNGKVIFIESYVKGKDKKLKEQHIILNPKEL